VTIGNVFEHLPRVLPDGTIIVEETHTFRVLQYGNNSSSTKHVYLLDKAPIDRVDSVSGIVDGDPYEFTKNSDYQVVDDSGDGDLDSIDFDVGGEQPDDNTEFTVTYVAESVISRYIESHEADLDATDVSIDEVIDSRHVDQASGSELDRIGAIFGELGKRRGRTDAEYQSFIKSIVQSFNGRGTLPGLKFAIAAGVGSNDPDNDIVINEDFSQTGYKIQITNTNTGFITGSINDLAQLADPSGVELLSPPVIISPDKNIDIEKSESTVTQAVGLGGGTLDLDGTKQVQ